MVKGSSIATGLTFKTFMSGSACTNTWIWPRARVTQNQWFHSSPILGRPQSLLHQGLPPTSVRHTGAVATGWFAGRRVSAAWHAGSHRRRWGQTLPDGHSGKPWDAFRRWRKGQRGFADTAHEVAKGQYIKFLKLHPMRQGRQIDGKTHLLWENFSPICGNRLQAMYVAKGAMFVFPPWECQNSKIENKQKDIKSVEPTQISIWQSFRLIYAHTGT